MVNQTIQQPWGVSTFGSALVQATPDTALLKFSVVRLADKPAPAFEQAHDGAEQVRRRLSQAHVDDTSIQTSRVLLEQAFEHVPGGTRKFLGYRTTVTFQVRIDQLDIVEQLLIDLVDAGANQIEAVRFHSSQLPALRAQARQRAVAAARRKAELYADAAGASIGPVLHIEDVNPDSLTRGGHGPDLDLSEHDDGEPAPLSAGSITVAAAVMIGFALHDT